MERTDAGEDGEPSASGMRVPGLRTIEDNNKRDLINHWKRVEVGKGQR